MGTSDPDFDVVIVGAGFAGMYLLHRLRGLGMTARAFDIASDVGGTWYWNRYPGARCDVESLNYSYSFDEQLQQDWQWTERFAAQSEILDYANHVADRFDLRRDIQFDTRVERAVFDEPAGLWRLETDRGDRVSGRYLVMATGCLSLPKMPDYPGLDSFAGRSFHPGRWPHEPVDFTGRRVGLIGTGATGIQIAPMVAQQAAHLFVFQRTASFSLPMNNAPMDKAHEAAIKSRYADYRREALDTTSGVVRDKVVAESPLDLSPEDREAVFERYWQKGGTDLLKAFADLGRNKAANDVVADFVRRKIRAKVTEPRLADLLAGQTDPIGTRRVSLDTNYFEMFNRDNVTLVDVKSDPIERITPDGVQTAAARYPVDDLIFATGFDAISGALLNQEIVGKGGVTLREAWKDGPRSYLGLMMAGFPNLFTITGPGSPSVLTNVLASIEQHVDFVTDLLAHARGRGATRIEATAEAQDDWARHVNELANRTLHVTANSWYRGVNVPGKPQIFLPYVGGFHTYYRHCMTLREAGYPGFALSQAG